MRPPSLCRYTGFKNNDQNAFIMNLSSEKSDLIRQIQSWQSFANNRLETEKQKKEFKDILNDYSKYAMVIIASEGERFPSKPLVTALLSSQYKRIMRWMVDNAK
jgi:hypothetical protein